MMPYRTELGWRRASPKKTCRFAADVLAVLSPIQRRDCTHWQCRCGCFDMVTWSGRVYCQRCGRLRFGSTTTGPVYYTPDNVRKCEQCLRRFLVDTKGGRKA